MSEFKYKIENEIPTCRIKKEFENAGKLGRYFGRFYIGGRWWGLVAFDFEDDPILFKLEGLEIKRVVYQNADNLALK